MAALNSFYYRAMNYLADSASRDAEIKWMKDIAKNNN